MTISLRRPASDAALTHGFALLGDLLSLLVQRKLGKETHPGIRVSLRSTPLLPVPLRGPAYKGRPCPFTPLAASLRLVPLRNTSTRPTDGEFARMTVSRFRPDGVVGLPRRRAGATRAAASRGFHPPYSIVPTLRVCGTQRIPGGAPTQSVGTINKLKRHHHTSDFSPQGRAGIGSRQEAEWNRCVRG